jgi:hypothetical protein
LRVFVKVTPENVFRDSFLRLYAQATRNPGVDVYFPFAFFIPKKIKEEYKTVSVMMLFPLIAFEREGRNEIMFQGHWCTFP